MKVRHEKERKTQRERDNKCEKSEGKGVDRGDLFKRDEEKE